jgi:outer membrane biosynthesis protein TonB
VEITETAPVEAKWARWAWFVYPALAIFIGGGLGYIVAIARQETEPRRAIRSAVKPVVAAPVAAAPKPSVTPVPSAEIEVQPDDVQPDPVKAADGQAPRVAPKPKAKPKPAAKRTQCNVYDHMNGC